MSSETRVRPDELAFTFRRVLARAFKGKPTAEALIPELVDSLVEETPRGAFEALDPFDHGIIFYHDSVDQESARDLNSLLMSAHLALKKKIQPLELILSSFGGDIYQGLAIFSTIQRIQRDGRSVNIHVPGYAMSCGSIILQAATHRSMEAHAWIMIHNPWWDRGADTYEGHRDFLAQVEREIEQYCGFYAMRSGIPVAEWRKMIENKDVFLTADQALDLKLVDEVLPPVKYPRVYRRKAPDSE